MKNQKWNAYALLLRAELCKEIEMKKTFVDEFT
jgi:hypothetical protein